MSEAISQYPASPPAAPLRLALEATVGADAAAHALQLAGQEAAAAVYDRLAVALQQELGEGESLTPDDLDETAFWQRLAELTAGLGWGRLTFDPLHPGVGALESPDWIEADPTAAALRPSCHFTVGLLANLLGRVAGAEIGVLEVACRSRGDLNCRFLFGGRRALGSIYESILAGAELDDLTKVLD